jgi:hypothetical protein
MNHVIIHVDRRYGQAQCIATALSVDSPINRVGQDSVRTPNMNVRMYGPGQPYPYTIYASQIYNSIHFLACPTYLFPENRERQGQEGP